MVYTAVDDAEDLAGRFINFDPRHLSALHAGATVKDEPDELPTKASATFLALLNRGEYRTEQRLLQAIRSRILNPDAVHYLIGVVKQQLDAFRSIEAETRRDLEKQAHQVDEELRNIERAILAGVLSETTAALLQDREAQRRSLRERVTALDARSAAVALRVDGDSVTRYLTKLEGLLNGDAQRSNVFFRSHVAPITCAPVKEQGRQFYRATVAVNGSEMIKSLGQAQAFDFGGCGGWIA